MGLCSTDLRPCLELPFIPHSVKLVHVRDVEPGVIVDVTWVGGDAAPYAGVAAHTAEEPRPVICGGREWSKL